MTRLLLALLLAGCIIGTAAACPVRSRVVVATPVVPVSFAKRHVATLVVPAAVSTTIVTDAFGLVAFSVPSYGGSYAPQAHARAAKSEPSADTKAILEALKAIDGRLRAVEGRPPAMPAASDPAPGPAGELPGVGVLRSKCASCHEAKSAADKGGGFVLFDGSALANLTDRQWLRIGARSYAGTMPPAKSGVSCTDADVASIQELLASRK